MMRIIYLVAAVMITACASQGPRRADMPLLSEAQSRLDAKDYAGASQIYQRLIEESDAPDYYRLHAADAELKAGDSRIAQALLSGINADALATDDWYRYVLLASRMDLNRGNARAAMSRLDTLNYQRLDPELAAHYHMLRSSAYNQLGNMLESARERVELGKLLSSSAAIDANNMAVFDALNRLPDRALIDLQPPPPDVLSGWMALTQILRGPKDQQDAAIRTWKTRYLGHPADGAFLDRMTSKTAKVAPPLTPPPSTGTMVQPERHDSTVATEPVAGKTIGVLLPLSGTYSVAGSAIKTGLEAARGVDGRADKPAFEFVDTNNADVAALYRRLVERRVDYVIGPLIKSEIAAIAAAAEVTVPVLALNVNSDVNNPSIFQFGLSPEQDVEQSAASAWFDGWHSALVLAPSSAYGQRMINHFSTYWRSLGGAILAVKTYTPGGDDFSVPAKSLLDSAAAGGNTADFIFLVADGRDGSLLKPYLEAQQQNHSIPIYATALIFDGNNDRPQSPDLSGIVFCDIPWFLRSVTEGTPSRESMRSLVDQIPDSYRPLVAMGLDAYRLVFDLPRLQASSQNRFEGNTGVLTLESGNRINRQLTCGRFSGGKVDSRGLAPLLRPGAPSAVNTGQPGDEER